MCNLCVGLAVFGRLGSLPCTRPATTAAHALTSGVGSSASIKRRDTVMPSFPHLQPFISNQRGRHVHSHVSISRRRQARRQSLPTQRAADAAPAKGRAAIRPGGGNLIIGARQRGRRWALSCPARRLIGTTFMSIRRGRDFFLVPW